MGGSLIIEPRLEDSMNFEEISDDNIPFGRRHTLKPIWKAVTTIRHASCYGPMLREMDFFLEVKWRWIHWPHIMVEECLIKHMGEGSSLKSWILENPINIIGKFKE